MRVEDIMTRDPATCAPDAKLGDVARRMRDEDCGAIPIVQGEKPIGIITDRDIVCRAVAAGKNPLDLTARDCMTAPCHTVRFDADLEECIDLLQDEQIRRVVVIDDQGRCCGLVAQADIARKAGAREVAEVVREVSKDSGAPAH